MSQELDPQPQEGIQPDAPQAPVAEPVSEPQTFDAEYVRKLRAEAAQYRTQANELKTKVTEFERAQMTEQQKLQADLDTYRPKAERSARLEAVLTKQLETQREGLPSHITALLDRLDVADQLDWLAENQSALRQPVSTGSPTNPARPQDTPPPFDPKNPPRLGMPGLFKS